MRLSMLPTILATLLAFALVFSAYGQRLQIFDNGQSENGVDIELSPDDCSLVVEKGLGYVILEKTQRLADFHVLPKVFNGQGVHVKSCDEVFAYVDSKDDGADTLFLVPELKQFIFPTGTVGHMRSLRHVAHSFTSLFPYEEHRIMTLETLSEAPRVFRIHNFFHSDEADFLVDYAMKITDEPTRLKRSSTGAFGYTVNEIRTSENAFDADSHIAVSLRKRAFSLLGIPFDEELADGLQVLRYNQSTAYISHLDWIEAGNDHDYDSSADGTNRIATIFLYLSDVEEGGETVFPQARKPSVSALHAMTREEAVEDTSRYLEMNGLADVFPPESWQRKMVADCRTMFSVKPKKGEAILFYSQQPNGEVDNMSIHGGCPVIHGTKWAANLWVWNGPRNGYMIRDEGTGKMRRKTAEERLAGVDQQQQIQSQQTDMSRPVTFINIDVTAEAILYWEDQLWSKMEIGTTIDVNSFVGHRWFVHVNGQKMQWIIDETPGRQRFELLKSDLL